MRRVSTSEAIVNELTRQILDGVIRPGTFMREIELADAFGVSRQSLRAALADLVHVGLLRREPHRGVWVPELRLEDIEDLYTMRSVLEEAAARRLATGVPDWQSVEDALRKLRGLTEDGHWSEILEADFGFHRALVAAAGSPRLSRSHEMLCSETRLSLIPVQHMHEYRSGLYQAREHEEIVQTIRMGNADLAAARIRKHLNAGLENAVRMRTAQTSTV
jgi:DNA-binding GntR family transcriptional regulator